MMIGIYIAAVFVATLGVIGLMSPALPGLPLLLIAAWLTAYAGDYEIINVTTLMILLAITLGGMMLDFVAGLIGAKRSGAGKLSLFGAFFGGVIGIFFGLFGMVFGPIFGAAIGEFIDKKDMISVSRVSVGTLIGLLIGVVARVGCGMVMVSIVLFRYFYWLFASGIAV